MREGNNMDKNIKKMMEKYTKRYQEKGEWIYDKNLSKLENLKNFRDKLTESFRVLVLLRCESSDVVDKDNIDETEISEKKQKEGKPFRKFDENVFKNQLAKWAVSKKSKLDQSQFEIKDSELSECRFKTLLTNLDELIEKFDESSDSVVTVQEENACREVDKILNELDKYKGSRHFIILKRVRLRKKFFDIFGKSLKNFVDYTNEQTKTTKTNPAIDLDTYPIYDLLLDRDYDKIKEYINHSKKGLSVEEKFEYLKEAILHGLVCFIGACKYMVLKCKQLDETSVPKVSLDEIGELSLDSINWSRGFIVTLKSDKEKWKKLTKSIDTVFNSKISSATISQAEKPEDLDRYLPDIIRCFTGRRENIDEFFDDGKNQVGNWLHQTPAIVLKDFCEWFENIERYLKKLIMLGNQSETKEEITKNEEVNNKKRTKVTENKEKNKEIDENLKANWQSNKASKRKTLSETVEEANKAHEMLKKRGILFDRDNVAGKNKAVGGYSKNFVKLFIRYLERSFPELDDCVEIYYYENSIYNKHGSSAKISDKYWSRVRQYTNESKTNGKIYFIVNEYSVDYSEQAPEGATEEQKRLLKGNKSGHGNLTVICNGKSKVFETVKGIEKDATGSKNFGSKMKSSGVTIQNDHHNCLAISMGYMESLLKQLSQDKKALDENNKEKLEKIEALKQKKEEVKGNKKQLEEVEEELRNKEKEINENNKKELSGNMFNEINRFSTVELPNDIKGIGNTTQEPMKILLPTKYIKYMQSTSKIEELRKYIHSLDKNDKDYKILQEVENELKMVMGDYTPLNQPVTKFSGDLNEEFKNRVNLSVELLSPENKEITTKELIDILEKNKALKISDVLKMGDNKSDDIPYNIQITKLVKGDYRDSVEKELTGKPIYKIFNENPIETTAQNLSDLEKFVETLKRFSKMNLRAQMKRRTETLKIATLVETLDKSGASIADEIDAVRDF